MASVAMMVRRVRYMAPRIFSSLIEFRTQTRCDLSRVFVMCVAINPTPPPMTKTIVV